MDRYGSKLEFYTNQALTGEIHPDFYNKPELFEIEMKAWNTFAKLSPRRPISGMGHVGNIPYTELFTYIDNKAGVTDCDNRDELIELIEFLDEKFLEEVRNKQEAERKKAESKRSTKTPRK